MGGGGVSGTGRGGFFERMGQAAQDIGLENHMTNEMNVPVQAVFPEKYGVSLDVFLKNQLQGARLNLALDMVQSGNTVGATNFHVIE